MNPSLHILFVDDEQENLFSFYALFRRKHEVVLAKNAEEGMELIKDHPIQLVISDQRMPGLQGLDFLKWLREYDENIVRILISGSISVNNKCKAKKEGLIHDWIGKPWKLDELEKILEDALEMVKNKG